MTREERAKRIQELKDAMWYEEMGEYIDWKRYREYEAELRELEAEA